VLAAYEIWPRINPKKNLHGLWRRHQLLEILTTIRKSDEVLNVTRLVLAKLNKAARAKAKNKQSSAIQERGPAFLYHALYYIYIFLAKCTTYFCSLQSTLTSNITALSSLHHVIEREQSYATCILVVLTSKGRQGEFGFWA